MNLEVVVSPEMKNALYPWLPLSVHPEIERLPSGFWRDVSHSLHLPKIILETEEWGGHFVWDLGAPCILSVL